MGGGIFDWNYGEFSTGIDTARELELKQAAESLDSLTTRDPLAFAADAAGLWALHSHLGLSRAEILAGPTALSRKGTAMGGWGRTGCRSGSSCRATEVGSSFKETCVY
jgi:hypothetical protein